MHGTDTPRERALTFSHFGRELAAAIDDAILAALPDDHEELTIYAHRLRMCNRNDNVWIASDLHNKHGEAYDGSGRFWHCGLKLCSYCVAKTSRANRKKLRDTIEGQKLIVGENYQMLTLTIVNKGVPLLQARQLLNDAWSVFRKKTWFRQTIIGGCKSEEFTLTKLGYHYHMHVLVRSKYIDWHKLRYFWTLAVEHSFALNGETLRIRNKDGLLNAQAKRISSTDDAIKEVAKYITTAGTWQDIPTGDLLDICRIRRFPRMFEMFGTFAHHSESRVASDEQEDQNKTILGTQVLTDDLNETGWREKVAAHGAVAYLGHLETEIIDQSLYRIEQLRHKYTAATFWRVKPLPIDYVEDAKNRLLNLERARLRLDGYTALANAW